MPAPRLSMRKIREVLRLKHERGLLPPGGGPGLLDRRRDGHALSGTVHDAGPGLAAPPRPRRRRAGGSVVPPGGAVRERVRPDCAWIHRELTHPGVTLHLLWEESAQGQPGGYRYSQFCAIYRRWVRRLRPSMRQVHRAGEKTFIDYSGRRPVVVDRHTGEVRSRRALRRGARGEQLHLR